MTARKAPSETDIACRLRVLADDMFNLAVDMDYYGGLAEWAKHAKELRGASVTVEQWAESIEPAHMVAA